MLPPSWAPRRRATISNSRPRQRSNSTTAYPLARPLRGKNTPRSLGSSQGAVSERATNSLVSPAPLILSVLSGRSRSPPPPQFHRILEAGDVRWTSTNVVRIDRIGHSPPRPYRGTESSPAHSPLTGAAKWRWRAGDSSRSARSTTSRWRYGSLRSIVRSIPNSLGPA